MSYILGFLSTASALIFWEIVKQIGVRLFKSYSPEVVAQGLIILDKLLPQIIGRDYSPEEVEEIVRGKLGFMTGNDWQEMRLRFDPMIFLNKNYKNQEDSDYVS